MTEPRILALGWLAVAWLAGVMLGAIFFGGLWVTIRGGVSSERPALWFLSSLVLRTAVVLTGFYFVSGGNVGRLLSCLAGFVTARFAVTRVTRPQRGDKPCALVPTS
jgi:F1F0 ATPase subunit 2